MSAIMRNSRCKLVFLLTFLAGMFFAPLVWADGYSLMPPASDMSVYYLSQIFGTIDAGTLGISGGPPLMGVLFKVFNNAVLILGSIILSFYTAMSVVNMSNSGKFLNERENALWKPVRMTVGVALLLPKSTGYNWVQVGFMWIILQGIGAADQLWFAALNYFSQGGGVLASKIDVSGTVWWNAYKGGDSSWALKQVKNSGTTDTLTQYITNAGISTLENDVTSLLTSAVCVLTHSHDPTASAAYTIDVIQGSVYDSNAKASISAQGLSFGPNGICGSFVVPSNPATSSQTLASTVGQALIEAVPLLQQIAPAFADPSHKYESCDTNGQNCQQTSYYDSSISSTMVQNTLKSIAANIGTAIQSGMSTYANSTMDNNTLYSKGIAGSARYNTYNSMLKSGWIFAGNYYNDLVTLGTDMAANVKNTFNGNLLNVQGVCTKANDTKNKGCGNLTGGNTGGTTTAYDNGSVSASVNSAFSNLTNSAGNNNGSASSSGGSSGSSSSPILEAMGFSSLTPGNNFPWINSYEDPIAAMAYKGWVMMVTVETIFFTSTGILFILGVFFGIGAPYTPAPTGLEATISYVTSVMVMVLTAVYTEGVLLAKYVPLIPFIMYMSAALGWMMIVFEAMIAAPVVALGLMHHEGHDMYGKSEPAIMLILNVFLRPSLTLLGFIGALLFTHVAIDMLNTAFSAAMPRTGTTVFSGAASIAIYVSLVIAIMNKVFSLIYQVPDRVLRWVGDTSQGVGGAEEMMQGAKGATESFGRESTQPSGDFVKGAGSTAGIKDTELNATQARNRQAVSGAVARLRNGDPPP